ncbi:MAG: AtpZ/AtpI family protein [Candidatus Magasanikbacteria bacterium]|nr:AtpZ/AtpI family protein [Candidatus Magasanikbacteria bacterium]
MSLFENSRDREYAMFGLKIAGDFGVTLFAPVILFVWIGKTLDTRFDLAPLLTILGFVVAAILSALMIYRKAHRYNAQYLAIEGKGVNKEVEKK